MYVEKISESEIEPALFGIGLSFALTSGYNVRVLYDKESEPKRALKEKLFNISKKLAYKSGGENKFLRMLNVTLDINAPLYWWKQYDTYKIGTVAQSESTMHSIMSKEFQKEQFQIDNSNDLDYLNDIIPKLNNLRRNYMLEVDNDKEKEIFRQIIKILPSSWLQRRIVTLNYSVLQNIIKHRTNHKLNEWQYFCRFIRDSLNYAREYLDIEKLNA